MIPLVPPDWATIFVPDAPIFEMIVRISVIYLFLFGLLRVVLKRESSGVSISDLLVLVLIADAVQNGMAGQYTSIGDALVLGATLVFWDWALSWLSYHQPWFRRLVRPRPLLIIQDGRLIVANARRELLTREDIAEQLRLQGVQSLADVQEAHVEASGEISVTKKTDGDDEHRKRERHDT